VNSNLFREEVWKRMLCDNLQILFENLKTYFTTRILSSVQDAQKKEKAKENRGKLWG